MNKEWATIIRPDVHIGLSFLWLSFTRVFQIEQDRLQHVTDETRFIETIP